MLRYNIGDKLSFLFTKEHFNDCEKPLEQLKYFTSQ
jgi:hypothetical protein